MKSILLLTVAITFITLTSCENPAVLNGLTTVGIDYAAKRRVFTDDYIAALRAVHGILLPSVTAAKNPGPKIQP